MDLYEYEEYMMASPYSDGKEMRNFFDDLDEDAGKKGNANDDIFESVISGEYYEVFVVKSQRKITLQKFLKSLNEIEATMYAVILIDNQTGETVYRAISSLGIPPCFSNLAAKKIIKNYWEKRIAIEI